MKKILIIGIIAILGVFGVNQAFATNLSVSITNQSFEQCGTQEVTFSGSSSFDWAEDNSGTQREQFRLRVTLDGNEIYTKDTDGNWTAPAQVVNVGDHAVAAKVQHRTSSNSGSTWSAWSNVSSSDDTDEFTITECPDVCSNLEGTQESLPDGYHYDEQEQCVPDVVVVPTCEELQNCPTPKDEPKGPETIVVNNTTEAPQCSEANTSKVGANFHIYRKGEDAIAKWFATEGNKANIYIVNLQDENDKHSLIGVDNDGYEDNLHLLGSKDWKFGLQQTNGSCSGGQIVWVEDGGTENWVLFRSNL